MSGVDPAAGRTDRMLLSAVRGGPDRLVSGELPGTDLRLRRRGRPVRDDREAAGPALLTGGELRRLTALAGSAPRPVVGAAVAVSHRAGRPDRQPALPSGGARELGLATVTGEADAVRRFPPGTPLLVDGSTGEVAELGGRP